MGQNGMILLYVFFFFWEFWNVLFYIQHCRYLKQPIMYKCIKNKWHVKSFLIYFQKNLFFLTVPHIRSKEKGIIQVNTMYNKQKLPWKTKQINNIDTTISCNTFYCPFCTQIWSKWGLICNLENNKFK